MNSFEKPIQPAAPSPEIRQELQVIEDEEHRVRNWTLAVLAIALAVVLWRYGYPLWQTRDVLSSQVKSMQDMVGGLGPRMAAAEDQLQAWTDQRAKLESQMAGMEKRVRSSLGTTRKQTEELAATVGQRISQEISQRLEPVKAELAELQQSQQAERTRIAQVQDQVAGLRREVNQQIAELRDGNSKDLAGVSQRVDRNKVEMDRIARIHDRRRVDFEAVKGRADELAPGISLTVDNTDVAHQSVDGWISLAPDGRTLWVTAQKIQEPLLFYTQQDDRPHELVFSRVADHGVVGYVLVPRRGTGAVPAVTSGLDQ